MDILKASLHKIRCKNAANHPFFPSHLVREVMEPESVREALLTTKVLPHHVDEAAIVIRTGAWNVFAILIMMKEPQYILNFIGGDRLQRSTIDDKLPYEIKVLDNILEDAVKAEEFYDLQWGFSAPLFSSSIFARILPDEFVLPFLKDDDELGEGSFGKVYKMQVEHSYQRFGKEPYHEVVRKEFKSRLQGQEFEAELHNLSLLRRFKHPNIIELLGCYIYKGKHNLIFPLARGGTLADFLKEPRPPAFNHNDTIIMALAGLCSAVHIVHEQLSDDRTLLGIGCHHDLKPSNIFVDGDRFLLADFGLSRFKEAADGSETTYKNVGGYYVAPECQVLNMSAQSSTMNTTRASDIWSLGCILLETLVYMKMGPEGVKRFGEERRFSVDYITFHRFHRGPSEEEPAVVAHLAKLHEQSTTKSERMFVELISQMLCLNPTERPKAGEVETQMWFIAIASVSDQIQELYHAIWEEGMAPQAFVEQKRFESWLESCETLYTKGQVQLRQWSSRSYSGHQSTLQSLTEMRDSLGAILPEVQDPAYPIYQLISDMNTSLLGDLPIDLQVSAQRYLETQILGTELESTTTDCLKRSSNHSIRRVGMLLTIRMMNSLVAKRSETRRPDLWLPRERLSYQKKIGDHYIGRLEGGESVNQPRILYESKKYGEHQLSPKIQEQLHARLEAIAELLQEATVTEFRVLKCLGYFHDPATLSCGLAYMLPNTFGSIAPDVITLRTVLAEQRTLPDLGKRIALARNLAASLLRFHHVGWLQKEISSFNIAFAYPEGNSWRNGIDNPYFLGFSSSRPDEPNAFSEFLDKTARSMMDFQHPEYLRGNGRIRYRQEFDYYSLGLVLLELGYWKPLDRMIERVRGSPEDVLIHLQKTRVPQLGQHVGAIYRRVVEVCLGGKFAGSGDVDGDSKKLCDSFAEVVVEPLSKCLV